MCVSCNLTKPKREFYTNKSRIDDYTNTCKTCIPKLTNEIGAKVCSHCKLAKPTTEYYRNKSRKDGFAHACKTCDNIRCYNFYHNK